MGTEKSRQQKIEWMMKMYKKFKKDETFLVRQFILTFSSTRNTAKEILSIVKGQSQLKLK